MNTKQKQKKITFERLAKEEQREINMTCLWLKFARKNPHTKVFDLLEACKSSGHAAAYSELMQPFTRNETRRRNIEKRLDAEIKLLIIDPGSAGSRNPRRAKTGDNEIIIDVESMERATAAAVEQADFWRKQAGTAENTRLEDLIEAYKHISRAGAFADIMRQDLHQRSSHADEIKKRAAEIKEQIEICAGAK